MKNHKKYSRISDKLVRTKYIPRILYCLSFSAVILISRPIIATGSEEFENKEKQRLEFEVLKLKLEVETIEHDLVIKNERRIQDITLKSLAIVFTLIASLLGVVATIRVARLTRMSALDQSVHRKRIELYPGLVKSCAPLAIYFPTLNPKVQAISPIECNDMGTSMSSWYFDGGGLLLSTAARDAYFELINALTKASLARELKVPIYPSETKYINKELIDEYKKILRSELDFDDLKKWEFGEVSSVSDSRAFEFKDYVFLQSLSSKLRTKLTEDLRSRELPD